MTAYVLRDIVETSLDGEWGKGEPAADHIPMRCIRGTDFAQARVGSLANVPLRHIAKKKAARKTVVAWDLLIEVAGGTKDQITGRTLLVKPGLVTGTDAPLTCASFSRFVRIRRDLADPAFVFWYLQHLYNSGALHAYHTQHTGVARFQWTVFADREPLHLPELREQRRIAGILSAYDDLIENCERRIRVLDAMARAIYREWFVLFHYPGHEKTPLVDSPLGRTPKGWQTAALSDVTSFLSRGISPSYDDEGASLVLNQKCIRDQRLDVAPARRQNKPIPKERRIRAGDVLINSTGVGTLGRVAQVLEDLGDCTVDTHVTIVRANSHTDVTYLGLALIELQPTFERKGVGATGQTELSRTAIGEVQLAVPPDHCQRAFAATVDSMRAQSLNVQKQAASLRKTRDLLLPRLLSGELSADEVT